MSENVVLPTRIISIRKESNSRGKSCFLLCDDGKEYRRRHLATLLGLHPSTINTRIIAYEFDSPLVLHRGPLSQDVFDSYGVDLAFSKSAMHMRGVDDTGFDRKRCRRSGVNCEKYSECLSVRLGLTDQNWEDPGDTDNCYTEPRTCVKYGTALVGTNGFGAYQTY